MRLLKEILDGRELGTLKALLEERGIPVYVAGTGLRDPNAGETKELWICLEGQYEDAVALLGDPHHKVAHSVDVAEFYRIAAKEKQRPLLSVPAMVGIIVGIVLFVAIAVILRTHV